MATDYETRARSLIRAREFEGLAKLLEQAAAARVMTPRLEIWAANLARERGELERSVAGYRRALEQLPGEFAAWFNLGLALEGLGRLEQAVEAFARALGRPGGNRAALLRLGACLEGLGQGSKARKLYARGVETGLLVHAMQRPQHYCEGLRAQPLWPSTGLGLERLTTPAVLAELHRLLEEPRAQTERGQWRSPALAAGRWDKLFFGHRGQLNPKLDALCPNTMAALRALPLAAELPQGNICLSILEPGTELHPHCGPTNVRLRAHLGLRVPEDCGLEVGEQGLSWREHEWLVFDDSFEHRAWNRSDVPRVIMIVDLWHPQLEGAEARRAAVRGIRRS